MSLSPPDQAVVQVALARGWIHPNTLQAVQASSPPGGLLRALVPHLPPEALVVLRQVYQQAQQATAMPQAGAVIAPTHSSSESGGTVVAPTHHGVSSYAPQAGTVAGPGHAAEGGTVVLGSLDHMTGALMKSAESPGAGSVIGGFRIERELARGGMGVVYIAHDEHGRAVALKLLLSELAGPEMLARFAAEAEVTARFNHPNVVGIHASGVHGGQAWYAMQLVEGESLQDRLDRGELYEPREGASLMQTVTEAMGHVHSRGVLHRDLKPDNVLLATPDARPVITDFGVARRDYAADRMTRTGDMVGTPAYMPPEQAAGEIDRVDPRSDVYALGATLYAVLTGVPPFGANQGLAVIKKVLQDDPPAPSTRRKGIPRDLDAVVLKCLNKEPEDRYADAAALADDLSRFVAGRNVQARLPGLIERLRRRTKRHGAAVRVLVGGAALGVLLLAGAGVFWITALAREKLGAEERAQEDEETGRRSQGANARARAGTLKRKLRALRSDLRKLEERVVGEQERLKKLESSDDLATDRLERLSTMAAREARKIKIRAAHQAGRGEVAQDLTQIGVDAWKALKKMREVSAVAAGIADQEPELARLAQNLFAESKKVERDARYLHLETRSEFALKYDRGKMDAIEFVETVLKECREWEKELESHQPGDPTDPRLHRVRAKLMAGLAYRRGAIEEWPPDMTLRWGGEAQRFNTGREWMIEAYRRSLREWMAWIKEGDPTLEDRKDSADEVRGVVRWLQKDPPEGTEAAVALEADKLTGEAADCLEAVFTSLLEARKAASKEDYDSRTRDLLNGAKSLEGALIAAKRYKRCLEVVDYHIKEGGRVIASTVGGGAPVTMPPALDRANELGGHAAMALGDFERARDYFFQWSSIKTTSGRGEPEPFFYLALCERRLGNAPRALTLLKRAVSVVEYADGEDKERVVHLIFEELLVTGTECGLSAKDAVDLAFEPLKKLPAAYSSLAYLEEARAMALRTVHQRDPQRAREIDGLLAERLR